MIHQERDQLRAAANAIVADTTLPDAMREAAGDVSLPTDIEGAMGAMVSAILAAETEAHRASAEARAWKALADRYSAAEDTMRATLLAVMDDTGAPAIRTAHATASTSQGKQAVVITDASLLPAAMTTQLPPVPNKAAIRAALDAGECVPGASLSNGAPVLRIMTRKGDAQ